MATNPAAANGSASKPTAATTSSSQSAPKVRIPAPSGFGSAPSSSGSATTPNDSTTSGSTSSTFGAASRSSSSTPANTAPKAPTVIPASLPNFGTSTSRSATPQATPTPVTPLSGGGLFGSAPKAPTSSGTFGAPTAASTSGFGASTSTASAQPAPTRATSSFGGGLFSAASKAAVNSGAFGASTGSASSGFGSLFGGASKAPATPGTFGGPTAATSSAFGASTSTPTSQTGPAAATSPFAGTGSLFGAPSKAPTTSGTFGAPAASTSAFGSNTATPSTQAAPPAFGTSTSTTAQAAPAATSPFGGSLFGAAPKAPTSAGAFGAPIASSSSGFGANTSTPTAQAAPAAPTSSGFGASTSIPTAQVAPGTAASPFGGGFSAFGSNSASQAAPKIPEKSGNFDAFGRPTRANETSSFGSGFQSQNSTSQYTPFSAFGSGFSSTPSNTLLGQTDGQLRQQQEIDSLSDRLARELSLADERNKEIKSLQRQNQTLVRENDLLRRKFQSTSELTRSFEKNWNAIESLLNQSGVLPYTQLLTQVNRFNDAVSTTASFLSQSVVCRSPDAFQEELDRAAADVQALMGPRLNASLSVQSQEAENGSEKPHSRLALILLQIFVLRFSILGITKVHYHASEGDSSKQLVSTDTRTLENFKSAFLRNLSSVMKTASWAIPVRQSRIAFETLLDSLFKAKEDLRTAVEHTFADTNVEIVVHEHGVPFNKESMVDAFMLASTDGKEAPVSDEVVGTMGIGLRKTTTSSGLEGGSSQDGLVLRAQVVLEPTLQGALNGDDNKPLEDLIGHEPARDGDGRA